jgi:hypothetical protein
MRLHVVACYVHDATGDLLRINDWIGAPAPRFWLGLTADGCLWRFRHDVPRALRAELEALCRDEPRIGAGRSTPKHDAGYRRILDSGGDPNVVSGPTYWAAHAMKAMGSAVRIVDFEASLLRGDLEPWRPDVPHQQPFLAAVEAGRAVSVCASVRITPEAHEAGVETLPEHRRRGHALAVVSAWARAVQGLGCVALYSTSWDNRASQAVAARLGLEAFGQEYRIS